MEVLQRALLVLPAGPESPAVARRQARSLLTGWGCPEESVEDTLLIVSELVGNAVLHAGQAQSVVLVLYPDRIRVEVADRSATRPARTGYGPSAQTGRGLTLLDSLTLAWGVSAQAGGKVVWADVPSGAPTQAGRVVEAPPATAAAGPAPPPPGAARVVVRGVPVRVYQRLQQQYDAVRREVDLLLIGGGSGLTEPPPAELLDACRLLRAMFEGDTSTFRATVLEAAARGETVVDLEGFVPATAHTGAARHLELVERIESYATSHHLFVDEPDREVVALRHWFVSELEAQLDGRPPGPPLVS